ncbi:hypothetical protein, partial [Escherichia coli]|uniref:hypothetical protein n=2 Tax=Escherichia coli TaxID=562 RepID=UPI001BDC3880
YLPRIGQVENMSVEGLFVHGGDLWRLNTPLSCLQPPQQGKTHIYTVSNNLFAIQHVLQITIKVISIGIYSLSIHIWFFR